jgi:hypothetical protein
VDQNRIKCILKQLSIANLQSYKYLLSTDISLVRFFTDFLIEPIPLLVGT